MAADAADTRERTPSSRQQRQVRLGLLAEPGLLDLAEGIAASLLEELRSRFPEVDWRVEAREGEPKDPGAQSAEIVRAARRRMLDEGWDLAVCLTDLPLRAGRRPVTAVVSPTEGVALISVPALGAVGVEERVRDAVLRLIQGLIGSRDGEGADRARVRERLQELASPMGDAQVRDDQLIRFSTNVVRGNLRLLIGMVRANDPWRVVIRLSRAMVAAVGTAAYVLASFGFWALAANMTWPRLLGLMVVALAATSATLILAHKLWERPRRPEERERVALFNTVTTLTIVIGVGTLYLGLFAFSALFAGGLIPPGVLGHEVGEPVDVGEYLQLAWLASSLATLAGALGSMTESDLAVREAAYGYRLNAGDDDDGDSDD